MLDKEQVKTVIEAINETAKTMYTAECKTECCCPKIVIYFICTNCTTINNGAYPDWEFCEPTFNYHKG